MLVVLVMEGKGGSMFIVVGAFSIWEYYHFMLVWEGWKLINKGDQCSQNSPTSMPTIYYCQGSAELLARDLAFLRLSHRFCVSAIQRFKDASFLLYSAILLFSLLPCSSSSYFCRFFRSSSLSFARRSYSCLSLLNWLFSQSICCSQPILSCSSFSLKITCSQFFCFSSYSHFCFLMTLRSLLLVKLFYLSSRQLASTSFLSSITLLQSLTNSSLVYFKALFLAYSSAISLICSLSFFLSSFSLLLILSLASLSQFSRAVILSALDFLSFLIFSFSQESSRSSQLRISLIYLYNLLTNLLFSQSFSWHFLYCRSKKVIPFSQEVILSYLPSMSLKLLSSICVQPISRSPSASLALRLISESFRLFIFFSSVNFLFSSQNFWCRSSIQFQWLSIFQLQRSFMRVFSALSLLIQLSCSSFSWFSIALLRQTRLSNYTSCYFYLYNSLVQSYLMYQLFYESYWLCLV